MKTNLLRTSIVAVVAAAAAYAQGSTPIQGTVPFDFIVGNRTLPAGQYTVDQGTAPSVMVIRSADRKGTAIVLTHALHSTASRNEARLVFHRYGYTYFLSEVWGPGNDGRQLRTTSRERELAANLSRPDNTTIAALR